MPEKQSKEQSIEDNENMNHLRDQWNQVLETISKKFSDQAPSGDLEHFLEQKSTENLHIQPQFLILLGAAGAGKSTIAHKLQEKGIEKLPIVTTRPPLPGEENRSDYFFMTQEEFLQKESKDEIINPVKKTETWRGILKDNFLRKIQSHQPFFIESKRMNPGDFQDSSETAHLQPLAVFLLPPSFEELVKRLRTRTSEMEQKGDLAKELAGSQHIEKWIQDSIKMLKDTAEYIDLYVVNDKVDQTAKKISGVFKKE